MSHDRATIGIGIGIAIVVETSLRKTILDSDANPDGFGY
jgi:hypothetical protein